LGQYFNWPLLHFVVGVGVALRHSDAVMAEEGPHGLDVNAALNESRGEGVPQIMEAESRDPGLLADRWEAPLEACIGFAGFFIRQGV
jgi:hypothetical protein